MMANTRAETCSCHYHHISVMELGHVLTRSGLTYPEVSAKVYDDSFCHLGSSISLPWVIYFEAYYLHVITESKKKLQGTKETEHYTVIYSGVDRHTRGESRVMIWIHKSISHVVVPNVTVYYSMKTGL